MVPWYSKYAIFVKQCIKSTVPCGRQAYYKYECSSVYWYLIITTQHHLSLKDMGRAHFLCCLPARLGVFIFSLLETLAAGFLAAVFIIALIENHKSTWNTSLSRPTFSNIARRSWHTDVLIPNGSGHRVRYHCHHRLSDLLRWVRAHLHILLFIFRRLTQPFRLIGAIAKKAAGVRAYANVVGWLLGLQIIWGIIGIVALWVEPKAAFIRMCEGGKTDQNTVDACTNNISTTKGVVTGLIILSILLHGCEFFFLFLSLRLLLYVPSLVLITVLF